LWVTSEGTVLGPRSVYILASVLLIVVLFIRFGYKELKLTSFDPAFASALGISTALWHYLLMAAVSLATVSSFESVGAILVIAFFFGPLAIAYVISVDMKRMLAITVGLGILISFAGDWMAYWLNASIAGCMAVVTLICFASVFSYRQFRQKRLTRASEATG